MRMSYRLTPGGCSEERAIAIHHGHGADLLIRKSLRDLDESLVGRDGDWLTCDQIAHA